MTCELIETIPSPQVYNQLRQAVGWRPYTLEVIEAALPNSLFCLCARQDGQIVGMARILGDSGLVYYIQDVIVLPAYQRQGIGTCMMDRIMTYIREHAHQNTIVGLMAAKGKEPFYEKYGFVTRPTDSLGSGMTVFWETGTAE
jgi:ribosomal protein S18 acetylase RimI-like enzyme